MQKWRKNQENQKRSPNLANNRFKVSEVNEDCLMNDVDFQDVSENR